MKKILLSISICFFTIHFSYSQAPSFQWQKCLGGSGNEYAESVIQTSDGGYAVAGYSNSTNGDATKNYGDYDFWVLKLTANGTISWQKNYGGSKEDKAKAIIQTSDGGYAVAGYSQSSDSDLNVNHGDIDMWVIKISSTGALQWQKSLGGSQPDNANSLIEAADSGIIVAGETQSSDGDVIPGVQGCCDSWVVKLNRTGTNIVWKNRFGGGGGERAKSIIKNKQGDFIVFGIANSSDGDTAIYLHGGGDFMILKINPNGVTTGFNTWGGNSIEEAGGIVQTSDGGYAMAGSTYSNDNDATGNFHAFAEWWVVKVNSSLQIQWQKQLGGFSYDYGYSIAQTPAGDIIAGGYAKSGDGDFTGNKGQNDIWLVKFGNTGNIIWKKNYGGSGDDFLYSLKLNNDGTLVFAGSTSSNNGDVTGNHGMNDIWFAKTGSVSVSGIEDKTEGASDFELYPNPATNQLTINLNGLQAEEVNVYNIDGRLVSHTKQPTNNRLDISELARGVYIAEVKVKEVVHMVRWVKL